MAIRLRTSSAREYLLERADELDPEPAANPHGMCILSGRILAHNLKEHLNRNAVPTTPLAHFTTIEDLAADLLRPTDEPHRMLADGIRDRLIEGILAGADPDPPDDTVPLEGHGSLRSQEQAALEALAIRLPYTEEDTLETLGTELDDYYRWTDATADTSPAVRALGTVDNRFAQLQSNRAMNAFRGFERLIEGHLSRVGITQHQSRSHLVSTARDYVREQWPQQYDHVDWIAVSGISVFDNPTLRFLERIAAADAAPDIEVFSGQGSAAYNSHRFDALANTDVETAHPGESTPDFRAVAAQDLFDATRTSPTSQPTNTTFIETPTDQRAVERIAAEIRDLLQNDVHPRDILIVAPDAGSYQSLIEQAFETVEIPFYVETRRPYADIPAYRCFRALVEVVEAVATETPITYDELVDPLRVGYCPRGGQYGWPIEGRAFTKVEQELHRKQQFYNRDPGRYEDQGIPLTDWRDLIDDIPDWTGPWTRVTTYLDDIEALAESPPATGDDLVDLFSRYLSSYVYQTVDHERELYTGPAIDTTRTTLTETHPTSNAERVRSSLDQVGAHYDRVQELFTAPANWREIGRAFSATLGGQSYGESHIDQYAIPVVDAGNTYFRDAKYLFILGMNADEFPGEAETPTFLHKTLRQTVYQNAIEQTTPYHHLDSRATNYGEALDFYQATLAAAEPGAEITLCHTYQDDRGNTISWSPFLDLFELDDETQDDRPVERISVGSWLPQPRSESESWSAVTGRVAPRERLRILLYQAHRDIPSHPPSVTPDDLRRMMSVTPTRPLPDLILPRVDRHHEPPTAVEIDPDEPAFSDVSLTQVTGQPHHPHELDLQAQCGLKYYYYQFLYNFTGSELPRDDIPKYYSSSPHWRLGELPYIVRENYADPRYVQKWQHIITTLLPERQSDSAGLMQFNSDEELSQWVAAQDAFDSYDFNTIYQNLRAERQLVAAELEQGVTRSWDWRDGNTVEVDGVELAVPSYRLDTITNDDSEYRIPIFFTRFSDRASSALKTCFDGQIWETNERTGELCLACDRSDNCSYHSKYVIDHRMLAGHQYESEDFGSQVVGIGLQEQYADPSNGGRVVAIQQNYIRFADADLDTSIEQLVSRGYPQNWDESVQNWTQNFTELAETVAADSPVTLEANPTIVTQDDCLNCVYRDLCRVPDSEVDL
jgi:hypothetical protein